MIDRPAAHDLDLKTLRVITLVRDFALKDYHEKRGWLHDRWLKDSELLSQSNRAVLSYPDVPNYPTEAEILTAAREIIQLMKNPVTDADIKSAEIMLAKQKVPKDTPPEEITPEEIPPEEVIVEETEYNFPEILEQLYNERNNKNQGQQT
jgi:hypothetical protein